MDRYAALITVAHNARALFVYALAWSALLLAAIPFGIRLRQAAKAIDRRLHWERNTSI